MVIAMIIRAELKPVILTPISVFRERRLSVTIAMDSPKERASLSMTFTCLKNTSVQAKPGRRKTRINARIDLMTSRPPEAGRIVSSNPRKST